jgi:hypothetical protein
VVLVAVYLYCNQRGGNVADPQKQVTMKNMKFRAFTNGKMRYDVTGFEHGHANEMATVFLDGEPHKIGDGCNVMQFIGLTDMNGQDVYADDKIEHADGETAIVKWHQSGWALCFSNGEIVTTLLGDVLRDSYVFCNIHQPLKPTSEWDQD